MCSTLCPHRGPEVGGRKFYGRWLLAIAKADALRNEIANDRDPFSSTEDLPQFATHATALLSRFDKNSAIAMIPMHVWAEYKAFATLVEMGFIRTGHRYQMMIPSNLNMAKVENAAQTLAETNFDQDEWVWQGPLVTITHAQARAWQDCLSLMGEGPRSAEREWLLGRARRRKARRVGSKEDGPIKGARSCVGIPEFGGSPS